MLNRFREDVKELSLWRWKKEYVVAIGIISGNGSVKEDDGGICTNDKGFTSIGSNIKIDFFELELLYPNTKI